jgi:GTPase SAR1 family protein
MARIRTTGLERTTLKFGETALNIIDTGGERSERRKWPHALKDAQIVVFTVDISSFDRIMLEDSAIYQLDEDILVFDTFTKSKHFLECQVLLVFTKIDILERRIRQAGVDQWLPNNIGNCRDVSHFQAISTRSGKSVVTACTSLFSDDEKPCSRGPEKVVLEALLEIVKGNG